MLRTNGAVLFLSTRDVNEPRVWTLTGVPAAVGHAHQLRQGGARKDDDVSHGDPFRCGGFDP